IVPTVSIASPASAASVLMGITTSINGTAADSGGEVAGIEVSTDGGATWQAATGTTSWSYNWTPASVGTVTVLARATDDSGNFGTRTGVTLHVVTVLRWAG